MNSSKKYTTIIFLVSLTSILMQLLLTRIFSVILWYHFAFMAVSIAMLGISIAGLTVYFQKHKITETNTDSIIFKSSFIAPIVLLIVFLIVFNTRIYLRANLNDMLYLSFIYFIFILPFFFLAIISSIICSGSSLRGLSDVTITISESSVDILPISGLLVLSLSPPQPITVITFL